MISDNLRTKLLNEIQDLDSIKLSTLYSLTLNIKYGKRVPFKKINADEDNLQNGRKKLFEEDTLADLSADITKR